MPRYQRFHLILLKYQEACSKKKISTYKYSIYLLQILMSAVGHKTIVLSGAWTFLELSSVCVQRASLWLLITLTARVRLLSFSNQWQSSISLLKHFDVNLCKYYNYCLDVDECQTRVNNCRYACKNLVGTFMCVCPEGFTGTGDNCRGNEI